MNTSSQNTKPTYTFTTSPKFICISYIILTIVLGLISLASTGAPLFDWSELKMPFIMAKWVAPLCFLLLFLLLAVSVCIMLLTKVDHPETKKTNLILHLSVITLFTLWPMFLMQFTLPIVSLVLIIANSLLMIFTTYRFTTTSLWAGILYIIATLATLIILIYNFWIVLA